MTRGKFHYFPSNPSHFFVIFRDRASNFSLPTQHWDSDGCLRRKIVQGECTIMGDLVLIWVYVCVCVSSVHAGNKLETNYNRD